MNATLKKFLPHIIALVVFILITFVFFQPLFNGKKLRQSDISNWQGMSKEIVDYKQKTGKQTLWTNSMFGGMPAYQISVVYPSDLMQYVDKGLMLGLPTPANLFFLYLLGFYFLLTTLKVDQRLAVLGSIAFAFSSYFIIILGVGHNSKAEAIGYMAPVIAGIIMTYRGKLLAGAVVTGLALALEIYSNHLQITYYLAILSAILVIAELYNAYRISAVKYFLKASGVLALVAVVAAGTNITSLMATQEYGYYSTRGPSELTNNKDDKTTGLDRSYITDWSYGKGETMTLMIPNFKGGGSEAIGNVDKDALKDVDENFKQNIANYTAYFGDKSFTGGPTYVGIIICLLFVIGLFIVKGPMKWWLLASTVLAILLAWGKHLMGFTNFFLDHVPGYDKFRTVEMTLIIAEFAIPLLAVLALDQLVKNQQAKGVAKKSKASDAVLDQPEKKSLMEEKTGTALINKKTLNWIMGIMLGIIFLVGISPGTFTGFYTEEEKNRVIEQTKAQQIPRSTIDSFFDNIETARKHIVTADAWRSFTFLALASVLIFTFLRFKYRKEILIYGLIVLVLIDLAGVDSRYLDKKDYVSKGGYANPFPESRADEAIKQDTGNYRVLNIAVNTFNDASTSYHHQSIGGYHGAKLKRYKELIDSCLTPEMSELSASAKGGDSAVQVALMKLPALNMLNGKYIIYSAEAPPLKNNFALGSAWFVKEYKIVPDADAEILATRNFNPSSTAIVDQRFSDSLGSQPVFDSTAKISLTTYKPDDLTYHSKSSSEQLAVFSEIYYEKGWNAYVDGKLTPHVRANYVLRAMKVPAGEHTIEFKFEPSVYSTGEKISLTSSILLLLFAGGVGFMELKKHQRKTN